MKLYKTILLLSLTLASLVATEQDKVITCSFRGQLGNNMFQAAATYALSWDYGAFPCLPLNLPKPQKEHVFSRCNFRSASMPAPTFFWREPSFRFHPITYRPNMQLIGYFQSEKYFRHHRDRILQLFPPLPKDLEYIQRTYSQILAHPNSVGVQIRYFRHEVPAHLCPQYGRDYFEKAMAQFPEDALFVISTNRPNFAKTILKDIKKNMIFLKGEPDYIDLYILSMCQHNIISNSTFGWWAAWLNQNPDKKIICPLINAHTLPGEDFWPPEWTRITSLYD